MIENVKQGKSGNPQLDDFFVKIKQNCFKRLVKRGKMLYNITLRK